MTIVSLEPMKMVTQLNRKSFAEGTRQVGTPQCDRKETGSLKSRPQCPSMCHVTTLLLGHMSDNCVDISATIFLTIEKSVPFSVL